MHTYEKKGSENAGQIQFEAGVSSQVMRMTTTLSSHQFLQHHIYINTIGRKRTICTKNKKGGKWGRVGRF